MESQLTQLRIWSSADFVDWRSNGTARDYLNSIRNISDGCDYLDVMSLNGNVIRSRDLSKKWHISVGFLFNGAIQIWHITTRSSCCLQSVAQLWRLTSLAYFWHFTDVWKCQPFGDLHRIRPILTTCFFLQWYHELFISYFGIHYSTLFLLSYLRQIAVS